MDVVKVDMKVTGMREEGADRGDRGGFPVETPDGSHRNQIMVLRSNSCDSACIISTS